MCLRVRVAFCLNDRSAHTPLIPSVYTCRIKSTRPPAPAGAVHTTISSPPAMEAAITDTIAHGEVPSHTETGNAGGGGGTIPHGLVMPALQMQTAAAPHQRRSVVSELACVNIVRTAATIQKIMIVFIFLGCTKLPNDNDSSLIIPLNTLTPTSLIFLLTSST